MGDPNRRQFVAGVAACACAACPLLGSFAAAAETAAGVIDAGPLDRYTKVGVHDPQGAGRSFFLVNRAGRLYAVSATCTHKSVKLVPKDGGFKCPRHGSGFDAEGHVTKSPARKPLPRFAVRRDDRGHVAVDPSKTFGEKDWDDARAYISLK